jgi:hypothetical protein
MLPDGPYIGNHCLSYKPFKTINFSKILRREILKNFFRREFSLRSNCYKKNKKKKI